MPKSKVRKSTEFTAGGFIVEESNELRNNYIINTIEMLDPYPDAYKVFMKRVTIKRKGKPSDKHEIEWLIARPKDGHVNKGGYDLFQGDEPEPKHFQLYAQAEHACRVQAEAFVQSVIMKEPILT